MAEIFLIITSLLNLFIISFSDNNNNIEIIVCNTQSSVGKV